MLSEPPRCHQFLILRLKHQTFERDYKTRQVYSDAAAVPPDLTPSEEVGKQREGVYPHPEDWGEATRRRR